jgi:hypothetical protein
MLPVPLGAVSGYQYNDALMKVDCMAAFTRDFGATILNRLVQFAPRRPAPESPSSPLAELAGRAQALL